MIVQAVHPVAVRFVPRGGSHARLGLVAHRTPVELRDVPASAFEVAYVDDAWATTYHAHGGALWERVERYDGPSSVPDLVAWLSDEPELTGYRGQPFDDAFTLTPLRARDGEFRPRGTPGVGRHTRSMDADVEGASLAVQAHLDANVRIAGDEVFVRSGGPMVRFDGDRPVVMATPRKNWHSRPAVRLDRAGKLWDFTTRFERNELARHKPLPSRTTSPPPGLVGDEDVVLFANLSVSWASDMAAEYARKTRSTDHRARLEGLRVRASTLLPDAMLGRIGPEDAEGALKVVRAAMRACVDAHWHAVRHEHGWAIHQDYGLPARYAAFVDAIALPLLNPPPALDEDDAAALSGFAP